MTEIGNPIPRGTIDTDAPLVDEALAARDEHPATEVADTVSALRAEIDTLRSTIAERQSEAARQVRTVVRNHPLGSLLGAIALGYALALAVHSGRDAPPARRFW